MVIEGTQPLDREGRSYASMMDKPFEDIDPSEELNKSH